jgi:biopolymer transport protein ExbB/TolQ
MLPTNPSPFSESKGEPTGAEENPQREPTDNFEAAPHPGRRSAPLPLGVETPAILKQPEGRASVSAALAGLVLGTALAGVCFFTAPPGSILERMFNFHQIQAAVPASILVIFFWGLFLCFHRWRRMRASETVSSLELVAKASLTLEYHGVRALAAQLEDPNTEFNPVLCRLKALTTQWQLKPGLLEADLVLQQYVVDDEESTRRAYSLVRTFVWALPVLGLIGTVLGIAFAVGGFASFLGGQVDDVEAIKKSLVGITGGLSFAFLLTLLGLATSLVLMLLASGLETREERLYQNIQQRIVGAFLPVLQRVSPTKEPDRTGAGALVEPLKLAAEAILHHVGRLAETQVSRLAAMLEGHQSQITAWGRGLQDQASSAGAVVKSALEAAATNLQESGSEFLARLDLVRQTWKEQCDVMQLALSRQTASHQTLSTDLKGAVEKQARAGEVLATTLQALHGALANSATAVVSLESGLKKLADSPLERVATDLVRSLDQVVRESEAITKSLGQLTEGTRKTAEAQMGVQAAVKQLDDVKLVETLDAFRKSLARHADLVEKLDKGLKITLS